ncbi:TlpA family protein disulfide reductase [Chryseobacterium oryzae]|uniref:TlpA family protein disulfide reductase n=1 Tax=Chryseobacterium oryzae TaxID=2929799 RepID=A0ABY4BDW1_9FLAO|nr:TlpA disulfide reductase family protein [Chryseobacterium oryzae]UOE37343.1 TlpA family protein disulfide reductase [Chryseobacterium oryzae]
MEKFKLWLKKNWSTVFLFSLFVVLLVNKDAKAWTMRQIVSTGIFNPKIEEQNETSTEKIEEKSENLIVKYENDEIIQTSDLKGKVVFINFWASWCPPCRAEFPSVQKFYNEYKNHKYLVFLTVNLDDDPSAGKMYLRKENFSIPFLTPSGSISEKYFNGSLPTTVILDKSGKIRMQHNGMADYSKNSFYEEINRLLNE